MNVTISIDFRNKKCDIGKKKLLLSHGPLLILQITSNMIMITVMIIITKMAMTLRNINVTLGKRDIKTDISAAQEVFLPPPVSKVMSRCHQSKMLSSPSPSSSSSSSLGSIGNRIIAIFAKVGKKVKVVSWC